MDVIEIVETDPKTALGMVLMDAVSKNKSSGMGVMAVNLRISCLPLATH